MELGNEHRSIWSEIGAMWDGKPWLNHSYQQGIWWWWRKETRTVCQRYNKNPRLNTGCHIPAICMFVLCCLICFLLTFACLHWNVKCHNQSVRLDFSLAVFVFIVKLCIIAGMWQGLWEAQEACSNSHTGICFEHEASQINQHSPHPVTAEGGHSNPQLSPPPHAYCLYFSVLITESAFLWEGLLFHWPAFSHPNMETRKFPGSKGGIGHITYRVMISL